MKGLPLILSSALKGYSVEAVIETSGIVELCSSEGRGGRLTGALIVESIARKFEPLLSAKCFCSYKRYIESLPQLT